jgi:hypothetical protein
MQLNFINQFKMRTFFFFALLSILMTACGSGAEAPAAEETMEQDAPAKAAISLVPMPASPDFPDAGIKSMSYRKGQFKFVVDGGKSGYALGAQTPDADQKMCANSAEGQHIHLIVDTEPYAAKYQPEFEYDIPDGTHFILAFLSRSYHESIKHPAAAKVAKVAIADKTITEEAEITSPMLFYSRPKGTYVGKDTENVMLDFYLANVMLGEDYMVKVAVADTSFLVNQWQPYFLKNLPMGENTVTLTLVDAKGNTVPAPLNPVSRTFTLAEDKVE